MSDSSTLPFVVTDLDDHPVCQSALWHLLKRERRAMRQARRMRRGWA